MSELTKFDKWFDEHGPAALVIRDHLIPVEGADGVFFPATYAPQQGADRDKDKFQDCYHGEFDSWEAMAEEWLDSTGELNEIPARLRSYFDYQSYARDMCLSGEMSEHDGHFFWNN